MVKTTMTTTDDEYTDDNDDDRWQRQIGFQILQF